MSAKKALGLIVAILVATLLTGCISPIALKHAVLSYDKTVTETIIEQILLNIARARHRHPIHFTEVSNIAATFNFQVTAGATPPLGGLTGGADLSPVFGASMSENPTISISPINGEVFTQRLLTPIDQIKFYFLLRHGGDLGILLRLGTDELRLLNGGSEEYLPNDPNHMAEYEIFRRHVGQLASLAEHHHLFFGPIVYSQSWHLALDSDDLFDALEKGYEVNREPEGKTFTLTKKFVGRVVLTNYDPNTLSTDERRTLHLEANKWPSNEILVDIRPEHPGGNFPIHGTLRLRTFAGILDFLARGIRDSPEFNVLLDPRTPPLSKNPAKTLEVSELSVQPEHAIFSVSYNGSIYALQDTAEGWNREAFRLLYQMFQMTVTDITKPLVPSITIAK